MAPGNTLAWSSAPILVPTVLSKFAATRTSGAQIHLRIPQPEVKSYEEARGMDVDPVVPAQSPVRWIDMTRGDEEEGKGVHHKRVEVEPDDITTGWFA